MPPAPNAKQSFYSSLMRLLISLDVMLLMLRSRPAFKVNVSVAVNELPAMAISLSLYGYAIAIHAAAD